MLLLYLFLPSLLSAYQLPILSIISKWAIMQQKEMPSTKRKCQTRVSVLLSFRFCIGQWRNFDVIYNPPPIQ